MEDGFSPVDLQLPQPDPFAPISLEALLDRPAQELFSQGRTATAAASHGPSPLLVQYLDVREGERRLLIHGCRLAAGLALAASLVGGISALEFLVSAGSRVRGVLSGLFFLLWFLSALGLGAALTFLRPAPLSPALEGEEELHEACLVLCRQNLQWEKWLRRGWATLWLSLGLWAGAFALCLLLGV